MKLFCWSTLILLASLMVSCGQQDSGSDISEWNLHHGDHHKKDIWSIVCRGQAIDNNSSPARVLNFSSGGGEYASAEALKADGNAIKAMLKGLKQSCVSTLESRGGIMRPSLCERIDTNSTQINTTTGSSEGLFAFNWGCSAFKR